MVHSGPDPVTSLVLNRELDYAFASLDIVSKNESSWNYIRGLSRFHPECVERVTEKCVSHFEWSIDYFPTAFEISSTINLKLYLSDPDAWNSRSLIGRARARARGIIASPSTC